MPGILVLGVGNIWQTDDGVGVRVIEHLRREDLLPEVDLLDGGTAALDLLHQIGDRHTVIIVDAVQGGGKPGSIYRIAPTDIEVETRSIASLHQVGLLEMLAIAEHMGCSPKNVVIFGVEPKLIDWGTDLSPEICAAVPKVAALVRDEFYRFSLLERTETWDLP